VLKELRIETASLRKHNSPKRPMNAKERLIAEASFENEQHQAQQQMRQHGSLS